MLVIGRVPAAVPDAAARRGGRLGAARDRSAAAVPGRAARQLPGRRARVADRLGMGGPAGADRGRLGHAVRADRTTPCAACARSTCPSGRPTWRWRAWSVSGDSSPGPGRCSPRSSSCGGSRWPAARRAPRTAHWSAGGLAILMGVEAVVSVGGNLGLLPLAGVPFPLLSYGGTALVVHLAAIGVVLAVRRDGARRRLWALPRLAEPAAAARPVDRARALGGAGALRASTGGGCRRTQGSGAVAAGQEQMTRCVRLPAPRGAITDRHGAVLAVNAVDTGSGSDRVVVVPALLRARPGRRRPPRRAVGRPARRPARAARARRRPRRCSCPWPTCPAAPVTRSRRPGSPGCSWSAEPRRAYPAGALLGPVLGFTGVATPTDVERMARPATGRDRRPGRPRAAVRRRAARDQRRSSACTSTRRACRWRSGARQEPVPGADLRLSIDLGLQRAAGRQPGRRGPGAAEADGRIGAAVAMDPRSGQILAIASTPSFDNNVYGPPLDAAALRDVAAAPGSPMLDHVDPGRRAARVDVQARGGRREPGPPGLRPEAGPSRPGPTSPTAATPSATGSRWAR